MWNVVSECGMWLSLSDTESLWVDIESAEALDVSEGGAVEVDRQSLLSGLVGNKAESDN